MGKQKKANSPVNIQTVVLVAAIAAGASLVPSSLQSSRPSEKESLERTSRGDQVVPARLWQDPLEPVKNYRAKLPAGVPEANRANIRLSANEFHSLAELAHQFARRYKQMQAEDIHKTPRITVLQVMMTGGSYAEDAETRHRARDAVLTALGVAGYVPNDAEHIGYSEVHWPRGAALEPFSANQIPTLSSMTNAVNGPYTDDGNLSVPFEWFQASPLMVLVLWLNRDEFEDHPAKRLAHLKMELTQFVRTKATNDLYRDYVWDIPFKVLDPSLQSLMVEKFAPTHANSAGISINSFSIREALQDMEVYSTYATTADAVLMSELPDQANARSISISKNETRSADNPDGP